MRCQTNCLPYLVVTCLIGLWSSFCSAAESGSETVVRYYQTDIRYHYRIALLELALRHTQPDDGPFRLEGLHGKHTQARGERLLQAGEIDVAFFPTSIEREERFLPVRIPMLRGLLGCRVLLIHKDSVPRFEQVNTLDALRQLRGGFGSQWADMSILKANGLPIDGAAQYETLFQMLAAKRFDYFPRGISEAWRELESFGTELPNLVVEPHLALYYPYAVYYFVNRNNPELADRIRRGLEAALADGSFRALFLKYNQADVERANIARRHILQLANPSLPEATPAIDTSWWLNGESEQLD